MSKKIRVWEKLLIILCFISIGAINFFYSLPVVGTLECKHDFLKGILESIAACLEYIGLLGGIIFVILSKYKDKKYNVGTTIIIIIALVIPFILSTTAYIIHENDYNNDNCSLPESNWETISTIDS